MLNAVGVEQKTQPTFRQQLHEPLPGEVEQQVALSIHQLHRSSRTCHIPERYGFLIEDDESTNY